MDSRHGQLQAAQRSIELQTRSFHLLPRSSSDFGRLGPPFLAKGFLDEDGAVAVRLLVTGSFALRYNGASYR